MFTSNYLKFKKGFTLIEMIVSLAIFSVVAVIALGSLVRIMSANQKAQSLNSAMTNIGFALESMSRELRIGVGINYNSTTNTITFGSMRTYPSSGTIICYLDNAYKLDLIGTDEYSLKKAEATGCNNSVSPAVSNPVGTFMDMLSPSIHLTNGTSLSVSTGTTYKLITIKLVGYVGTKEQTKTYFNVQTSVSQRVSD